MPAKNREVSIIGAGSWGTTLAVILARKKLRVYLHSVFDRENSGMRKAGENSLFLPGVKFPRSLTVSSSLEEVLGKPVIVIAVPVKFMRPVIENVKARGIILDRKIIVSVAKGVEQKTFLTPSRILRDNLGDKVKIGVLSGPTIAGEVAGEIPTACVIASKDKQTAGLLQKIFSTERFRVYTHDDVLGVELGGALKNVIALACGISQGLGFGTNTSAALVTRGLVEMSRLGKFFGASPDTFQGISGLGDLVTTCFSKYSRNRFVGEQIGKGKPLKSVVSRMKMVSEGVYTARAVYDLSKHNNINMPITKQVYLVLYRNKSPLKAVKALMNRPLKAESCE